MSLDPVLQHNSPSDASTEGSVDPIRRGLEEAESAWPERVLDLGFSSDVSSREEALVGADPRDGKIRVSEFWTIYDEQRRGSLPNGSIQPDVDSGRGLFAASKVAPETFPSIEADLFAAHRSFINGALSSYPQSQRLAALAGGRFPVDERLKGAMVLEKLESNFRGYLRGLSERLDPIFEDQRSLRPATIWVPSAVPVEGDLRKERLSETELRLPFRELVLRGSADSRPGEEAKIGSLLRQLPGQQPFRIYTLLARVLNEDGQPLVAFDFNLNAHGYDPEMPDLELSGDPSALSTLMRVHKAVPLGREEEYVRSKNTGDFIVQFLFSPKSFEFELQQLLEGGSRWFGGRDLSYRQRRPYLAKVVEVAVLSAHKDIDPQNLQIDDIRPDPSSRERNILLVEANGELTRVTLSHSAPPKVSNPTYMISFDADPLSKRRLNRFG